jgi:NADPH:quinone reductase-like Zn-dependent oxidoreductase
LDLIWTLRIQGPTLVRGQDAAPKSCAVKNRRAREESPMKAVVLPEYGEADRLELREVPDPQAGAGEVKIRVAAASINPIDWKQRGGAYHKYMPLQLPAILGKDASGTVVEVGPGVTALKVGARVMGRVSAAYAELAVAKVEDFAEVPTGLDLVDAGALPLVLLTGAQLADAAGVAEGQTVLVTGALGSVGRAAVFVAKAKGAKVYVGVRKEQKAEAAKLRAHAVVALDDPDDIGALPSLDSVADTVGGDVIKKVMNKVKPGGIIGSVVGEPDGAKARGLVVNAFLAHSDSPRLATLARAVADGKLVIPIAKRFPLGEAAAAQKLAEKGAGGKVLLVP